MNVGMARPPFNVVWLDTWAVSEITRALKKRAASNPRLTKPWAEKLMEQTRTLRHAGKIVIPTGHQLHEIESGGLSVDDAHEVLTDLSDAVDMLNQRTVKDLQLFRTMEAVVSKAAVVNYSWEDLFQPDERQRIHYPGKVGVSVHLSIPKKLAAVFRAEDVAVAKSWERMRQENLAKKVSYDVQLKQELLGPAQAFRWLVGREVTKETEMAFLANVLSPLQFWKRAGGDPTSEALLAFLESPEHALIPSVRIKAQLIALKLTGQETIKVSDVTDIDEISSVLPFSRIMVIDGAMREKVVDRLKLDKEFNVEVTKLPDLPTVLNRLCPDGLLDCLEIALQGRGSP